jgi:magnesium transporter
MITSWYRTGAGELRRDLPPEAVREALADERGLLWIDITSNARDEGEPLLSGIFNFHPLTIDDCYNDLVDPPKIDDHGTYLFIIVQDVQYDPRMEQLTTRELDLYLGPNYVVSFHKLPVRAVEELQRRADNHERWTARGAGFLAHALIDIVVDDYHPVAAAIDEQVEAVQEQVIDRPERDILQHVLRLKRNAQRLKRSVLPQRDVANRLSRGEFALIPQESLIYFRDIYDHTVRVEELIDTVRDLAESALNTYLSSLNNRINEVMKTLAIVTLFFLPMTLITGVYGTNFEETLPEYSWNYGFAAMFVMMVALVVFLIIWVRARRWF